MLAIGGSSPVAAQVILEYGLGDQVGWSAQLADWKNALTIKKGAGSGSIVVREGTFSVKPGIEPRPDTNPYSAVWVEKGADTQDWAYLIDSAMEAEGDNLHGVYVSTEARLSIGSSSVKAQGENVTGIRVEGGGDGGGVYLVGANVDVSGRGAKGLYLGGGRSTISSGTIIKVEGENVTGIDVDGGELLILSASEPRNQISAKGIAGSDVTGMRFNSGSGYTLQGGGLINFDVDVQGDPAGRNSTGIKVEGAGLFADNKHHMYLGNATSGDEELKRITVNVKGGEADTSLATGLDINNDIVTHLTNAQLIVEGKRAIGVRVDSQASLDVSGDVEIEVSGYDVSGIDLNGHNQLSLSQGVVIEVAGTGEWISGIKSWVGGDISLSGVKLSVESTGPVYTFGTTQGLDVRENVVRITDGSKIDSISEYLAYGIHSVDSDIFLSNVTVSAASDQTARALFFSQDKVELEDSHLIAKGLDARVVTASQSTLEMSRAIVAAEDARYAIGVYGSESDMTLSFLNIDVEAELVATGLIADSGSELDLTDSIVNVAGGGGSTVGMATSTSSVSVGNTDITVKGIGTGWSSTNDTQAKVVDSRIRISGDGSVTAVNLEGTHNVQIQGASTLLSASSQDVESTATALQTYDGAFVQVEGGKLKATVLDDRSYAIGTSAWAGGVASFLNTQIAADGGAGEGIGTQAGGVDSKIVMTDSLALVKGEEMATGVRAVNGATSEIAGSTITVEGKKTAWGTAAENGAVLIQSTRVEVSAEGQALGVLAMNFGEVTLDGVQVQVDGGDDTYALAAGFGGTLRASGGTRLQSSGGGALLESWMQGGQVNLTDTEIISGGATLSAFQGGVELLSIDLGAGVVATDNNGTLLRVERDAGVPTGRVDLNIADGARVAGSIIDNVGGLAALTADGGTFVSLNNAQYSGLVQKVRGIQAGNGAHLGGGTVAAPNTVLENVSVDKATLTGNWQIAGALQARNGARIAPGNSLGVITTGSINWGAGTIYEVEVNDKGESDRVDVTGTAAADVSQTALHVMQENGTGGYRLDQDYTILTAAGGVEGEFTEAKWQGSELITVKPTYQSGAITVALTVDEQALDLADLTVNQRATAEGALSVTGLNAAADAAFLSANLAASFDMLSGEIHPSTRAGLINSSALFSKAILGRLDDRQAAKAGELDASGKINAAYPLWVSYSHSEQTAKGDSNTAERKHKIDSFTLGGEAQVGVGWSVGGAFAYADSKVKLNERRSSADVDSYGLALYAGKRWDLDENAVKLKVGVGHTWHDVSTRRNIDLGGSQTLKADYDARTTQLFGEVGYSMAVGERSTVEPYLALTWLSHHTEGFSESGGEGALKGKSSTDDVTFSTLGLRAATTLEAGGGSWTLHGGLGWRHAFGDRQPGAKLSFIQGGGDSFAVVGAPIAKNSAVFDLGVEAQVGRNTSIGLGYEGQSGSGFTEHAGNLYLKTRF